LIVLLRLLFARGEKQVITEMTSSVQVGTLFITACMLTTLPFNEFLGILVAIPLLGILVWLNTLHPYIMYMTSYYHVFVCILSAFILMVDHKNLTSQDILATVDGIVSLITVDRLIPSLALPFLGLISNKKTGTEMYTTHLLLVLTAIGWGWGFLYTRPTSLLPENPIILMFMVMRAMIPMSQVYISLFPWKQSYQYALNDMALKVSPELCFADKIDIYLLLLISNTFILSSGNNLIIIFRELA
jgi:hypothetical protein